MARVSPLGNLHELNQASIFTIGAEGPDRSPIDIVGMHESVELEYASLRRRAGLMDRPDRGVLSVTGDDRLSFLNNMLTQELNDLPVGVATRSFWLNRQGRIDADFLVVILDDRVLLECHSLCAPRAKETLESYVIADEVAIEDVSDSTHRLSLHGPKSMHMLGLITSEQLSALPEGTAKSIAITGGRFDVLAVRDDTLGPRGLELFVPTEWVETLWCVLTTTDEEDNTPIVRPVGWHAWNTMRVEAGVAEYLVDFSTDTLPHETGIIEDRVSFTKGCYLGQEIVARMRSRGSWKQQLCALRCTQSASDSGCSRQTLTT
ncbi:MAG: CAF17-like 4Fe-4S cluster assembly/insertion protein YgfZ [Planctomycetota bacterium]|jgi:folate-binding protein YgfZ